MDVADNVRFWAQVMEDSRRTLVVPPDLESRAIEMVKAHGVAHLVTVKVSHVLPEHTIWMIDEQAVEAGLRQAMTRRPTP